MAAVSKEIVFDRPAEQVFDVLVDYARYPEFVPGIKGCRLLPAKGLRHVEYELDLGLKRIKYVLHHVETRPSRITWSLVSGEMMRVSNGEWLLTAEGGATRARYTVDIQISKPPLIPQSVIDRVSDELTRVQLPKTLEAFKARVERGR
jgi:ribosome-associated toxin RatA of RatAB toxin-antitoxin module